MVKKRVLRRNEFYRTSGNLFLYQPTVDRIDEIGYESYIAFSSLFVVEPFDARVYLWYEKKIDYEDIINIDMFEIQYNSDKEFFDNALNYFLGITEINIEKDENGVIIYGNQVVKNKLGEDLSIGFMIDKISFMEIVEYYRSVNYYATDKIEFYSSQKVKEIAIMIKKEESEENISSNFHDDVFNNMISSLIWGGQGAINYKNIGELSIYQFLNGIDRLNKIKDFDHIRNGISYGTIDTKKIDLSKLNWTS